MWKRGFMELTQLSISEVMKNRYNDPFHYYSTD